MPVIETARLRLRPFTLDDADEYYHALLKDPDVRRYLPGGEPRPRSDAERMLTYYIEHWEKHGFGGLAMIHAEDNALIGECGLLFVPDVPEVEVFYTLTKAYWGQGFATEAARASLRYGFEACELDHIIALFVAENTASERVMIKLGMTHQGLMQAYNTELPCYKITRAEFDPGDAPYTLHP